MIFSSARFIAPFLLVALAAWIVSDGRTAHADQVPIALTDDSYNQDVVVEASAGTPWTNHVTGTMDNLGPANKSWQTWYERGLPGGGGGGLPAGAGVMMSETDASTTFLLRPYNANNVLRLDVLNHTDTITLTSPERYSTLSLLAASSFGPGFLRATLSFADGAPSVTLPVLGQAALIAPDWVGESPAAYVAGGSILNLDQQSFQHLGSTDPRLYQVELPLPAGVVEHPLQSIELAWNGTQTNAVTAIFAVSGTPVPEPQTLTFAASAALLLGFYVLTRRSNLD